MVRTKEHKIWSDLRSEIFSTQMKDEREIEIERKGWGEGEKTKSYLWP